jgi:hypothetical protein
MGESEMTIEMNIIHHLRDQNIVIRVRGLASDYLKSFGYVSSLGSDITNCMSLPCRIIQYHVVLITEFKDLSSSDIFNTFKTNLPIIIQREYGTSN